MSRPRSYLMVVVAATAVGAALAAASVISATRHSTAHGAGGAPPRLLSGIPQRGLALGRPSAPVTLVEYADLQCPYCAAWARETFPVLVSDYVRGGRLRIVWHGLAFLGPDSGAALTTVVAAGRQNHLWDLVEGLYLRQGVENSGWVTQQLLDDIGASVPGLDQSQLERDLRSGWTRQQITAAAAAAASAGVRGTPSFELGRTGGALKLVSLSSLGPNALRPGIEALLAR